MAARVVNFITGLFSVSVGETNPRGSGREGREEGRGEDRREEGEEERGEESIYGDASPTPPQESSRIPPRNPNPASNSRVPINPPPFLNVDVNDLNSGNNSDLEDFDFESDTDSISDAINEGNFNYDFVVRQFKRYSKSLKNIRRLEHGRFHEDSLLHIPRPSFPAHVTYRSLDKPEDFKIIEFNFPRIKFTGNLKSSNKQNMDVYEFLNTLCEGQKYCPVSKKDFIRILLARLAPPALGMVNSWLLDKNITITKLCNRLYKTFNVSIIPRDALEKIRKYLKPRNLSFDQQLSEMQYLADFAGRGGPNGHENAVAITYAVQDGLEHSLPERAYTICLSQMLEAKRFHNRELYLGELIDCLRQVAEKVDREIKMAKGFSFAKERDFLDFTSKTSQSSQSSSNNQGSSSSKGFKNNKKSVNETKVQAPQKQNTQSTKGKAPSQSQGYVGKGKGQGKGQSNHATQNNKGQQGQKVNMASGAKDKPFCSLCCGNNHKASDNCYSIVDDNLKQYQGPPTQDPCTICLRNITNKKMKHPEDMCPLRAAMIAHYKAGRYTPRGHFKRVLEENDYNVK